MLWPYAGLPGLYLVKCCEYARLQHEMRYMVVEVHVCVVDDIFLISITINEIKVLKWL